MQYAKRNAHRPVEKRKGNKKLPYIHVQDIEDYNSEFHRKKFLGLNQFVKVSDRYAGWDSLFFIFMQLAGWLPALHGQIIMGYR